MTTALFISFSFFKDFIYLFLDRGEGRERGKHQCVVASHPPPTGDLAHNPGMCPDWDSNWRPFSSQAGTQSTEPHQPGPLHFLKEYLRTSIFTWNSPTFLRAYDVKHAFKYRTTSSFHRILYILAGSVHRILYILAGSAHPSSLNSTSLCNNLYNLKTLRIFSFPVMMHVQNINLWSSATFRMTEHSWRPLQVSFPVEQVYKGQWKGSCFSQPRLL